MPGEDGDRKSDQIRQYLYTSSVIKYPRTCWKGLVRNFTPRMKNMRAIDYSVRENVVLKGQYLRMLWRCQHHTEAKEVHSPLRLRETFVSTTYLCVDLDVI